MLANRSNATTRGRTRSGEPRGEKMPQGLEDTDFGVQ
jgi:hypothetical protein